MRLSLIISFPLLLAALPAAAEWERLRPETEASPVIAPAPDAACREQARSIDARLRRAAAADEAGGGAAIRVPEETRADRLWFARRCFRPRTCPAMDAPDPPGGDGTAIGLYERLLRRCGDPDGQP